MPYRDFREFLQRVEDVGDMVRIDDADWNLEIGTMTELMCERLGPMLFFDNIKGYPKGFRIAAQPYSSPKRTALMLDLPTDLSPLEIVDRWRVRLRDFRPVSPSLVDAGPVTENVLTGDEIDLLKFPTPKWHELDGGRYLGTGCVFITPDINGQWINIGTYRLQIHDRDTTGVSIAPSHHGMLMMRQHWSEGRSCPVAVAMGPPPAVFLAGVSYFPWGTGEYEFAGWANGEPIEVIKGPFTGLPLPAFSEIIIEGEVRPPSEETRIEGPFGEYTGYYASGPAAEPVIKVKTLLHRNNPIIQGNPPMKPPVSHLGAPIAHAPVWDRIEKSLPGIKAVYAHPAGGGGHLYVVSVQQKYAGHAKQVGLLTMSVGASGGRYVVLTDDDIDPSNMEEVAWAIATRCDPATAISIVGDLPSNILDPAMEPTKKQKFETLTNTRAIINACRPYGWIKEFPPVNKASDETRKKVMEKWQELFGSTISKRSG